VVRCLDKDDRILVQGIVGAPRIVMLAPDAHSRDAHAVLLQEKRPGFFPVFRGCGYAGAHFRPLVCVLAIPPKGDSRMQHLGERSLELERLLIVDLDDSTPPEFKRVVERRFREDVDESARGTNGRVLRRLKRKVFGIGESSFEHNERSSGDSVVGLRCNGEFTSNRARGLASHQHGIPIDGKALRRRGVIAHLKLQGCARYDLPPANSDTEERRHSEMDVV